MFHVNFRATPATDKNPSGETAAGVVRQFTISYSVHFSHPFSYYHLAHALVWKTGLPVRSAVLKPHAGELVVGWVTTSESSLLEKTQDEIKLEQSGDIDALQRYRRNVVHQMQYSYTDRAVELLRIEEDLRSTVQEEQILAQKPETTRSWPVYRNDIQAELQALNKRYWLLERQWWKVRNTFVEGPLIRAFDLWRSHPLWYMHQVLVEDCIRRGGCCSRSCGCCVDRKIDKTRQLGAGHCMVVCGCCHRARGFELTKKEKMAFLTDFHVVNDRSFYRQRINRVSIWGLSLDSHDSPFDMIVIPLGYEKILLKEQMTKGKAEQVDEAFILIDKEGKEEVGASGY
ncbi:hypothetical protein N7445_010709 [Penicillium cf. griseofulvum]|nr:hypothetical protein N7445_010709 [Penicillium cf. griseofulvum]